jgi:hypothetical protein
MLSETIKMVAADVDGVYFADVSNIYGYYGGPTHGFCTSDPWVFGVNSILIANRDSSASFHPTQVGQQKIADVILELINMIP